MTTNIGEMIVTIAKSSGFGMLFQDPRYIIMIVIACVLLYLVSVKGFERHAAGEPASGGPQRHAGL